MKKKKKPKRIYKIHHGDCLKVMKQVATGTVNLCISDSPYNLGQNYDTYTDKKSTKEFLDWARKWLGGIRRTLAADGSFWMFMSHHLVSEMDLMIKNEIGLFRRSWVVWAYTFGQNVKNNFTPSNTHLLYYTVSPSDFTFNDEPILHPSARQVKYGDKRANIRGRLPDNTWAIFPELMPEAYDPAGTTWSQSRICGTFKERRKHTPNQIPIPIMERIISSTSNKYDLVLDPFCGSGSAGVAAKILRRSYIGIDISETCCQQSAERIAGVD